MIITGCILFNYFVIYVSLCHLQYMCVCHMYVCMCIYVYIYVCVCAPIMA